jgi:phosphate-selective porin OprO/OprP
MSARWNNGLELHQDRLSRHVWPWQMDTSWLTAEQEVQNNLPGGGHDGIDFRRARLRIDGTLYEVIEFACEYDFGNGLRGRNASNTGFQDVNITAITDLWLQFSHTPLGHIRVGNQKEPIGFEHLVSSRFLPFMERSYDQDTYYGGFFNGFTPGISATKNVLEDRASWAIGLYKPTENVFGFSTNDGDYAVTGRLTGLPIYASEGRQLRTKDCPAASDDLRQANPLSHATRFGQASPRVAGSADVTVFGSTMQTVNAELAAVGGPWTLQAEWLVNLTQNAHAAVGGMPVGPVRQPALPGRLRAAALLPDWQKATPQPERMAFDRMKPSESFFWVKRGRLRHLFAAAWQVGLVTTSSTSTTRASTAASCTTSLPA